jgi:hypothetical protein
MAAQSIGGRDAGEGLGESIGLMAVAGDGLGAREGPGVSKELSVRASAPAWLPRSVPGWMLGAGVTTESGIGHGRVQGTQGAPMATLRGIAAGFSALLFKALILALVLGAMAAPTI